jgi:colanic acid/amylovoran biosynthesis glycosyltransferase
VRYFDGKYPAASGKACLSRLGSQDYGLNPEEAESPGFHIVSCANTVPVKRVHLLAASLEHLGTPVTWTHFGTGPDQEQIREIISRVGTGHRTELKGWISHAELMKYYATHHVDLFVNTSSSEGVPVSVMEALSFGIPVIATDVGGTSEILDSTCGKLIPAALTPEILAAEIGEFMSTPDRGSFRANARMSWKKKSDCSEIYPEFATLLKKIV